MYDRIYFCLTLCSTYHSVDYNTEGHSQEDFLSQSANDSGRQLNYELGAFSILTLYLQRALMPFCDDIVRE
jgi:hypothetical protein